MASVNVFLKAFALALRKAASLKLSFRFFDSSVNSSLVCIHPFLTHEVSNSISSSFFWFSVAPTKRFNSQKSTNKAVSKTKVDQCWRPRSSNLKYFSSFGSSLLTLISRQNYYYFTEFKRNGRLCWICEFTQPSLS